MSDYDGNGDGFDVSLDMDFGGAKKESDLGQVNVAPGKYHAKIKQVSFAKMGEYTTLRVVFKILAGTEESMIGKIHTENFFINDNNMERLKLIAVRIGLVTEAELDRKIRVQWKVAEGRQVVILIDSRKFHNNKTNREETRSQITYDGIWSVTDERVADVPKDAEYLSYAGLVAPTGPARDPLAGV